jgi:hypothetical protein
VNKTCGFESLAGFGLVLAPQKDVHVSGVAHGAFVHAGHPGCDRIAADHVVIVDSHPQIPIQSAEVDGFEEVVGGDGIMPGEVGEGAGDFEDAVVGAGGKVHLLHGVLEVAA